MKLQGPAPVAARALLGQLLVRGEVTLRITEVEAYGGSGDSASHARHGRTARNAPMWGPPGRAYLYFCYGMHWMLNVVTGPEGDASAVLIRGAEVVTGMDTVLARRNAAKATPLLCAGPGKVAQALGLDKTFDGHDLRTLGGLELRPGAAPASILAGPRLGIGFATPEDQARPWRFADGGSSAVLKKRELAPWEG
ncbi:MAG: DNA-3-methyladenine glycosylase [Geothrix sp.]|uniref:DNA-3-methyladenine glycosylase n=1 Tax=Geothrix sp. TaxID=1962974 RepID=UPI0017D7867E|nr:DNA-3-methyladenine glycosylase [Geothrix sp.]NWJ41060.1 DNA-3-methyladenine glycosylase [Geothrix sp.]WIL20947.1 MAG: DNA-3-methyladenine glycosylase [Geothrix sp.]